MKDLEINIWMDGSLKVFKIEGRVGQEPTVSMQGNLDGNAMAGCSCILEVARCLLREQSIQHFFNPTLNHEASTEALVRCCWLRSGKLFCIGDTTKKFMHATNIEEAVSRKRTFTCTRELMNALPHRRPRTTPKPRTKETTYASPKTPNPESGSVVPCQQDSV